MPKTKTKQKAKSDQTGKKSSLEPNVTVYTDLPPDVHGQLRCYLVLKLDRLVWTGPRIQNDLNIVVKWWGEQSQGTVFRCSRLPGIAKYAIKCGPRQFSSYLNDMEALILDFIDSKSYRIQGVAKLDVTRLSKNNLILTDAVITVPLSDKVLGKINISMNIVPAPKLPENVDQPTLDRHSPLKVSSAIKHPRTSSANTSPIKYSGGKENVFPSKNIQRGGVTELINQVLSKSRNLKEELVKAQMQDLDNLGNIKDEIEANIDSISPNCIQEVDRHQAMGNQSNQSQHDNTVDFLFGKDHIDSVLKKHGLDVSFSSDSSVSTIHDESLIAHLFYNRGKSHDMSAVSSDSELDEELNDRSKKQSPKKTTFAPEQSRQEAILRPEETFLLSLNKITALGRVNKCKLFLDDLQFDELPKTGTFFIEYKIPIADEDESKTLTSRKISDRSVKFNHSNVFPVLFDEVLINQWQVRTAVFKIFYKERIEDSPELIADASLKLINTLQADKFELKFALQIRSIESDDYLGLLNGMLKLNSGEMSELFVPRATPAQKLKSVSLNMLISVVCGKAIQTQNKDVINSYVVARMIDSVERLSSDVVWDNHHPVYNCRHIIPFTYTSTYIDRLKDNFIILEVWNKSGTTDKLIGLCKLPTSQFYLSLSGENLQTFIEQEASLIAVDGYMPVIDILSNERCGILQCILAVGSHSQLTDLLSQKNIPTIMVAKTPAEKPDVVDHVPEITSKTRHMIHITVNYVQEMDMFEGSSWGATDCFISFTLPSSPGSATPELKTFTTSICSAAPHMKFNHRSTSSLVLSDATSVQQFLSHNLDDNCVVFELWRRFYYPNIRDQVCARGSVTLQQLSHLISLNPGTEHTFQLPLNSVQLSDDDGLGYTVGTLSIAVEYNHDTMTETQHVTNFVQLCVGVQRACGLQYAAQRALQEGAPLEHAATVGVDSYVSIELSFAGIDRETSLRARSFTPNYGSHFSITLPTVMSAAHSGPPTLAESLSKGSLLVSVFHKVEGSQSKANDILLCKTTVGLESLLQRQTGIHGWEPLHGPTKPTDYLAALELEVGFGEVTEREQVIQDGCGRGWVPPPLPSVETPYISLDIGVDRIWIPDTILTRYRGVRDRLFEDRQCYLRIKFYNSEAVCSDLINFTEISRDGRSYSDVNFRTIFNFRVSTNLVWCLREEALEIQVWLVPRGGKDTDDTIGDTILGCGYVSLSELLAASHSPATSAQVAPLVKATSASLGGAGLHVTTTLTTLLELPPEEPVKRQFLPPVPETEPEEQMEPVEEELAGIMFRATISHCTNLPVDQYDTDSLCIYCTLLCRSHTLLTTSYHEFTSSVYFNSTQDIRIPYSVFSGNDNNIKCVVSAYDLTSQSDVCVIGSATVDLSPLLIGFPHVEGWYLIEDVYSKDTFGQIKVSFNPLELVSKEIIATNIHESQQGPVPGPEETNFLKKKPAKRSDYLGPSSHQPIQPEEDGLKLENVFQSLADIENLIKSIGSGKVGRDAAEAVRQAEDLPKGNCAEASRAGLLQASSFASSSSRSISEATPTNTHETDEARPSTPPPPVAELHSELLVLDHEITSEERNIALHHDLSEDEPCLEEEGPCPLVDTFDITVDTDCLSDTISDITQLLQDVHKQTQNIDHILGGGEEEFNDPIIEEADNMLQDLDIDGYIAETHEEEPEDVGEDTLIQSDSDEQTVLFDTQEDCFNKEKADSVTNNNNGASVGIIEESATQKQAPMPEYQTCSSLPIEPIVDIRDEPSASATPGESTQQPRYCTRDSEDMPSISRPSRAEHRFKRPAVPDFFMAAKELSTTLTELRQQRQPMRSGESQESDVRTSTPVLSRRMPLTTLMRQGPNEDQRARIARIFKQ